ncbi:MAG: hypothetical protein QOG82_990 [Actinomycetota bacterium]|jgi:hypothetical protein|nr:hypothetical protein [Actinomycetota bacterium]
MVVGQNVMTGASIVVVDASGPGSANVVGADGSVVPDGTVELTEAVVGATLTDEVVVVVTPSPPSDEQPATAVATTRIVAQNAARNMWPVWGK